jgi:putative membrane protein
VPVLLPQVVVASDRLWQRLGMDTKWLIRVACAAAANAITIAIAAALLDRFEINAVPYIVAVAIFTAAVILIKPIAERLAGDYASGATWLAGLVATYIALLLADIFSDGIEIEGFGTWILATLIVWAGTLIYDLVDDKVIAMVGGRVGGAGRSPA